MSKVGSEITFQKRYSQRRKRFLNENVGQTVNGQSELIDRHHISNEWNLNVSSDKRHKLNWIFLVINEWILERSYQHVTDEPSYRVLLNDTNRNYAIVYNCKTIKNNKSRDFLLLSTKPQLAPAVKCTAYALIDTHFDRRKMYQAEQSAERCEPHDG